MINKKNKIDIYADMGISSKYINNWKKRICDGMCRMLPFCNKNKYK